MPSSGPLPFKEFGPYRIKQALGEGGMGVVYLAEREDLGNQVAIKILRDAWVSPARRERFTAEQRTLAQLNHPSIARLYDADTSPDGTPFFVMEYVEGVPLTDYCRTKKCTIPERLRLFRAVCEAVLYAHQHAVIHRDLKPSNILVKEDGSIRLLDFGIAKHLENLGELVDQTITGLRLMTPAYAAPEQIRGEQVGIHSDVYSLGVVLYELLAGRLPFDLSSCTPAQAEKVLTEQEAAKPSDAAAKSAAARRGSVGVSQIERKCSQCEQSGMGRPGCALPHGDAQGSAAPLPIGRSAHPRCGSLFECRASGSAARHVALHARQVRAAALAVGLRRRP